MLNSIKRLIQVPLNQIVKYKIVLIFLLLPIVTGCSSSQFRITKKNIFNAFDSDKFKQQHTGFMVIDLENHDTIIDFNSSKYFIPASTAKLFTLYTSLKLLGSKIPALKYRIEGNAISILGTGDPTWFHPHFLDSTAIEFLKNFDTITLNLNNHSGGKFGPGWAWEDYAFYFSPEITAMPLYGNVVNVQMNDSLTISPNYFADLFERGDGVPLRKWKENRFYVPVGSKDTIHIPYITSNSLTATLLSEKIGAHVKTNDSPQAREWQVLQGIATDSILKRMLWKSDNFLAEQLMLMASSTLSDTLRFNLAKKKVTDHHLHALRHPPRWVDGSGLSRYNLFTPESMTAVLGKLYQETDSLRLFGLMPRWNAQGTLDNQNGPGSNSFIYAKSGSMGNIYNLCGYLICKSGKVLAFSYMNNHFRRPFSEIRLEMFTALKAIHDTY